MNGFEQWLLAVHRVNHAESVLGNLHVWKTRVVLEDSGRLATAEEAQFVILFEQCQKCLAFSSCSWSQIITPPGSLPICHGQLKVSLSPAIPMSCPETYEAHIPKQMQA